MIWTTENGNQYSNNVIQSCAENAINRVQGSTQEFYLMISQPLTMLQAYDFYLFYRDSFDPVKLQFNHKLIW